MIAFCPVCEVERADYEGPGMHLPTCPNCGTHEDPVRVTPPAGWPVEERGGHAVVPVDPDPRPWRFRR